jgi:hypothetical protein
VLLQLILYWLCPVWHFTVPQAGDIERGCELLVSAGQWDRALALAPAASLDYWHSLISRRARLAAASDAVSHSLPS